MGERPRSWQPRLAATGIVALLALFSSGLTGCSVFMATKQPEKRDLSVLESGTFRKFVVAELGVPYLSEMEAGKKVDYYGFTQGYNTLTKTTRAVFHGVADIATLGLWELIGTPTESAFDGTEVRLKVTYDYADRVETVELLKGEEVFEDQSSVVAKRDPRGGESRGDEMPPVITAPSSLHPDAGEIEFHGLVRDDSPIVEFAVDGNPMRIDSDGSFHVRHAVGEDESFIELTAVDEPGNETVKRIALVPADSTAATALLDVDFGRYHGLVIGNDDYRFMRNLRTARSDAQAVAALLEKDYGFRIRLLENATRSEILGALASMRRELGPRDNVLIYYAGHGWLDEEANEGFWLPVDAEPDNEANWIANADISRTLKAMKAKHVMVVADSCFSGKLLRDVQITARSHGYLSRIARKRARVALASGGLEPVDDSGGGDQHSPFASALLEALEDNQSVMDGTQLFERIRRPVMLDSDQTPEYADIRKAGHDGGDFLFVRADWLASESGARSAAER
jgi:uncharacterized caspase-like protein